MHALVYTAYLTEQAFAVTTHQGQAQTMCQTLSLDFDAVITVSGDGVVHEILNGFAQHEDPISAFSIPVAPIPTGSGNGLCLNLLGREVLNNYLDFQADSSTSLKYFRRVLMFLQPL